MEIPQTESANYAVPIAAHAPMELILTFAKAKVQRLTTFALVVMTTDTLMELTAWEVVQSSTLGKSGECVWQERDRLT